MGYTLITAATFPQLESRVLQDVRAVGDDPLAPRWIIVPSATLANHLRMRLAMTCGDRVEAGIRIHSLPQVAERLSLGLNNRALPAWHPKLELTLFESIARLPSKSPLASLKAINGGATLLKQTFVDLAEAGFGVAALETIRDLAMEPEITPRERAVLELYAAWIVCLEKRGIEWAPLAMQALPQAIEDATELRLFELLGCEASQTPRLFVHGFYEWIDVQFQWLLSLATRISTAIYFPHHVVNGKTHPSFEFTDSVLSNLLQSSESTHAEQTTEPMSASASFFINTFPEGRLPASPPHFLSYQAASGVRAEAISAAVRVRQWMDQSNIAPADILVVAPTAADHVEAVQDAFRAFAIPLRVGDVPAGPTPEDQPLHQLSRIWEEQAPAEWVLALLRAQPNLPLLASVSFETFEAKVRELGIWGGPAWHAALTSARFDAAEKLLIESILIFVDSRGAESQSLVASEALAVLEHMASAWLPDPEPLTPLIEAVQAMSQQAPKLALGLGQWARLVSESVEARNQRDPLTQSVLFTPLMRARGLTAKAIVILGLAAGTFPKRLEDDPVLSETAAGRIARIASDIGHRMPLKSRLTEEMLLLFHLINTAADHIHWVIPETDEAGKRVASTPWVQRYMRRWKKPDRERISRSPLIQAQSLAALDLKNGGFLPPELALFVDPKLAGTLVSVDAEPFLRDSVSRRGMDPAWSGVIGVRPKFHNNAIGVTRLEALVRCPFRFYVDTVARWEPLEPLSLSHQLDVLTRGILLHRLLEKAVEPHLKTRAFDAWVPQALTRNLAGLWEIARALPDSDATIAFGLELLPPTFQRAALIDVVQIAAAYLQSVCNSSAVPEASEAEFRRAFPGLEGVDIVGKIDRIDLDGEAATLIDFKSGKLPRQDYRREVKLGWRIQAALYPWLCQRDGATFQYVFVGGGKVEIGDTTDAPQPDVMLRQIASIIDQGAFIPTSNQVMSRFGFDQCHPCRYCKAASTCRRFESSAAQRHAELYQRLMPERLASTKTVFSK